MPTLNWIGKDKVVNHHLEVLYMMAFAKKDFSLDGAYTLDEFAEVIKNL